HRVVCRAAAQGACSGIENPLLMRSRIGCQLLIAALTGIILVVTNEEIPGGGGMLRREPVKGRQGVVGRQTLCRVPFRLRPWTTAGFEKNDPLAFLGQAGGNGSSPGTRSDNDEFTIRLGWVRNRWGDRESSPEPLGRLCMRGWNLSRVASAFTRWLPPLEAEERAVGINLPAEAGSHFPSR